MEKNLVKVQWQCYMQKRNGIAFGSAEKRKEKGMTDEMKS